MSKHSSWIQIILFTGFISLFFVLNLLLPDKGFSEQENRELAQNPKFTFASLFEGKYTKKYETYTTDQFAFRDGWTTLKAGSEIALGKKENKGVYLCTDGSLIEKFSAPEKELMDKNVAAVKSLSEKAGVPVYFALIPGAADIRAAVLPKNAPSYSQLETIDYCYKNSGAKNIDVYSALASHADEYIFYNTDHHWTSLGAFYGYGAMMDAMGLPHAPLTDYSPQLVSKDFYGTVYSKSGFSWTKPDSIETFAEQDAATEVFNYPKDEPVAGAMYHPDFLEKKDKYSMFMGGITPLIKVSTKNTDAPSLLVLRDSYMDSVTPLMQENFSEIHIMDLRYYKSKLMDSTVADYIAANKIDEVLVCYSVNNFATDTNVFLMGN
ncbi:MAG: DHHW family protein [Oscillospiraceae bacterium]